MLGRFDYEQRPQVINHLMHHYGVCHETAEGIWQEAWLVLWTKLSLGEMTELPDNLQAWMASTCRFKALEQLRKTEQDRRAVCLDDGQDEDHSPLAREIWSWGDFDESQQLTKLHRLELVDRALDSLPPRQKALVVGFYVEGKSMRQLATELGYKSETVAKSTKLRVMQQLTAVVRQQQESESSPVVVFFCGYEVVKLCGMRI